MSLSSPELWQRIAAAGIATSRQCGQWQAEIQRTLSDGEENNAIKVLHGLIELKRLTTYQAKILAGQSTQPLRWGAWLVERRLDGPLWKDWYAVRHDNNIVDGSQRISSPVEVFAWARPVNKAQLDQLGAAAPSLTRARKLSALSHPGLPGILPPELAGDVLLVFTAPIAGAPLSSQYASGGCSSSLAFELIRQVARAMAALHQHGLAHGGILPDRIYLHEEQIMVATDPICRANRCSGESPRGLLGECWDSIQAERFMAPELHLPGQLPSPASDVYAIGCLWCWLLTGKPPEPSSSADRRRLDPNLHLSEPLRLCLRHALGNNLSSRFPTAMELSRALELAIEAAPQKSSGAVGFNATRAERSLQPPSQSANIGTPLRGPELRGRATTAKRRRNSGWLWPVLAGSGVLALLLGGLALSGALQPAPARNQPAAAPPPSGDVAGTINRDANIASDPRLAAFQIVTAGDELLWVPPNLPSPIPLDLLPPGGQLFISFRPAELLAGQVTRQLLTTFDAQLSPLLSQVSDLAGVPLEELSQVTAVFYAPASTEELPQVCLRCTLKSATQLQKLKGLWGNPSAAPSSHQSTLLTTAAKRAYYVAQQPLVDSQSVSEFSVGPSELMRYASELNGARAPLLSQLERLWNSSDQRADVSLFLATPYLFSEGRSLFALAPSLLADQLKDFLSGDARGAALQMRFEPLWYLETRIVSANDLDAGKVLAKQRQRIEELPSSVEAWLIRRTPHPYWRALALRLPQMTRVFADYSRFGIEHGTAIMNTYLPSQAANNLMLASWIACQSSSTAEVGNMQADRPAVVDPKRLTIEEVLDRPIRVSFDQEPIETALKMVGEEANAQFPNAANPIRFVLDGDAFEKAGITRNQQLRDFRIDQQSVRSALTEIAKRGNPVTTVTDLRAADQRLIWVVTQDPVAPAESMISLTTRAAATASGIAIPSEFAPSSIAVP